MKTQKTREKLINCIFKMMQEYKIEQYEDKDGIKIVRKSLELEQHELEKAKEYNSINITKR